MAEIKKVEVSGEELERRIRVQLEFSVRDAEEMLNHELIKAIAKRAAKEWLGKQKKFIIDPKEIGKQVINAIVQKAVFNLAMEMTRDGD